MYYKCFHGDIFAGTYPVTVVLLGDEAGLVYAIDKNLLDEDNASDWLAQNTQQCSGNVSRFL